MTTALELVTGTLADYLTEYATTGVNRVSGAVGASDTSVTLEFPPGEIAEGAGISIDLEDMRIWSVSGQTATVLRAYNATVAATHADDSLILVNPRFTPAQVLRAMNRELSALSGEGLFRVRTVELTVNSTVESYNFANTDLLDIIDVRIDESGPENNWRKVTLFDIERDAETDDFASGTALIIREELENGRPLRVTYKAPFSPLTALDNDVAAVTGLWAPAHDLLQLGAAINLMSGTEVARSRTTAQGQTRRAGEVPPGTSLQASRGLMAERERRLHQEMERQRSWYPPQMRPPAPAVMR